MTDAEREAQIRAEVIEESVQTLTVRRSAEQIMRDDNRRAGNKNAATMHSDRAQMLTEAITAIRALAEPPPQEDQA